MSTIIPILYQDDQILVINKPSGVLSIPDGYNKNLPHLKSILDPEFGRLFIVHRLDKETSGIMVLSKTGESHKILNTQFEERKVRKEYRAFIYSKQPFPEHIEIKDPLKVNGDRRHRTIISIRDGKPAATDFHLIQTYGAITEIAAFPHSGYTHQIRAHLHGMGCQILGDTLYSIHDNLFDQLEDSFCITRLFLHSFRIHFLHPISNIPLQFEAVYPDDFNVLINKINKDSPIH